MPKLARTSGVAAAAKGNESIGQQYQAPIYQARVPFV
jgi:hypothetical protein